MPWEVAHELALENEEEQRRQGRGRVSGAGKCVVLGNRGSPERVKP